MSIFDRLLTHTYTLTPITAGSEDREGVVAVNVGANVNAQACFYNPSSQPRLGPDGMLAITGPVLIVAANSALNVGDRVSGVLSGGSTLDAGPFTVTALDSLTLADGIEVKRARLLKAIGGLA